MRKSAPVAFLLASLLAIGGLFSASPAAADDQDLERASVIQRSDKSGESSDSAESVSESESEDEAEDEEDDADDSDEKRQQLEEKYGKWGQLSVPALVIRPMRESDVVETSDDDSDSDDINPASAKSSMLGQGLLGSPSQNYDFGYMGLGPEFIAINPVSLSKGAAGGTGHAINPQKNAPIDIRNVNFTQRTPAEVFLQSSQVVLYVMAAFAVGLASVAVSRAIRRK